MNFIFTHNVKSIVLILCLLAFTSFVNAQETKFNENAPAQLKDFAFWLGTWKFEQKTNNVEGQEVVLQGYKNVSIALDGYAIFEDFGVGSGEKAFRGGSLTVYDRQNNEFVQTWLDSSGWTKVFRGNWQEDQMILYGPVEEKDGITTRIRLIWKNITDSSMDWSYETSKDNGLTWNSTWDIHFQRTR